MNTPWGKADTIREICPGIKWVTTPGHGGMLVDEKLNQAVRIHRNTSGWYEEDCEWCIPWLYLMEYIAKHNPDEFRKAKDSAADTCANWYPYIYKEIFGRLPPVEKSMKLREEKFLDKHQEDFVVFSAINSERHNGMVECWTVMLRDNYSEVRSQKEFQALVPSEKYEKRDFNGYVLDVEDIKKNYKAIHEKYTDRDIMHSERRM